MENLQEEFQWANQEFLYALLIIPAIIIVFIIATIIKSKTLKRFGDYEIVQRLMPDASKSRPIIKFSLLIMILSLIIFAVARPRYGVKMKEVTRKGAEIIIALDVSNSMLAQDIVPNRLERAKMAISKLIANYDGGKIGLIVFAGKAYTQIPITADYSAAGLFLASVSTDIVPVQGTNIAAAIDLGMKSFSPKNQKDKALIIITDGENHEEEALEKAKEAKEKGITIFTIGMGLPAGAPIPTRRKNNFRKDKDGNTIISRLNESFLVQTAKAGGGIYTRANNAKVGLSTIYKELDKMESDQSKSMVGQYDDRFHYIIGLALLLIILEFFILERKNKWLKELKIFG